MQYQVKPTNAKDGNCEDLRTILNAKNQPLPQSLLSLTTTIVLFPMVVLFSVGGFVDFVRSLMVRSQMFAVFIWAFLLSLVGFLCFFVVSRP